jgi:hypothetical protein
MATATSRIGGNGRERQPRSKALVSRWLARRVSGAVPGAASAALVRSLGLARRPLPRQKAVAGNPVNVRPLRPESETVMTTSSSVEPEILESPLTVLSGFTPKAGQAIPHSSVPVSRGSPEGRYLSCPGKPAYRQVTHLQSKSADEVVKERESRRALQRAEAADRERRENHRGGDRPWPLRLTIPLGLLAEAVTAFVGMEVLVASLALAEGLSALTALIGGGMACILANRRLNRLPVPAPARILEGTFVAILTVLRYESLRVQGAAPLVAGGAAALAALISALGLIGIEEIVAETRTFDICVCTLRVSWRRWRCAAAQTRKDRILARTHAALNNLQRHFLDFLLKAEGLPLEEAQGRATALKAALIDIGT